MPGAAVLHIIGGNDRGKQHDLNRPETTIGRGTDQHVVLADIAVSRRHVTILMEGQRFRLKDLGSGNGSLVNGQRVDTVILNDGDQIEIGNTLMRFDHQLSRPQAAPAPQLTPQPGYSPPSYTGNPAQPPGYPPSYAPYPPASGYAPPAPGYGAAPPGYGAAPQAYPPGYHPPPAHPQAYPPGYAPSYGGGAPMDPSYGGMAMNAGPAPSYVGPPMDARFTGARRGPPSARLPRLALFGVMGLISVGGIATIVSRTVFAQPVVVASEAEDLYRQGLRLFAAGDYELAKGKFVESAAQATDAPEPKRYVRLCDTEVQARTSLKNAERALVNRHYAEAVRALDGVEPTSVYFDQASRQRKDTAPKAAVELVDEARRLAQDNAEESRLRLKTATELDPNNADARELLNRLRNGTSLPAAPSTTALVGPPSALGSTRTSPPPSAATVAAVSTTKESRRHKQKDQGDDGDLATVKVQKGTPAALPPDSKPAMALYKTRDFTAAARLLMSDSMRQPEKVAAKTIDFANQVKQLQVLVDRAGADEAKNPAQAVKEYEQAIQLDQKLGKGVHAAFFKQHIGGLGVAAAKQALSQNNYELAYQSAQSAQRGGADASAVFKQLEQKAGELVGQGVSAQKTNIGQAKQYWRTVLKMVPSSSPNYTRAYSLLNSATAPKRDEDED